MWDQQINHLNLIKQIHKEPYLIEFIEEETVQLKIFLEVLKYNFLQKQQQLNFLNYKDNKYYQEKNEFIFKKKNYNNSLLKKVATNEFLANIPFIIFKDLFNKPNKLKFNNLLDIENINFLLYEIPLLYFYLEPNFLLKAINILKEKEKWRQVNEAIFVRAKINEILDNFKIYLAGLIFPINKKLQPIFNSFDEFENKLDLKDEINLLKICFNLKKYTKDFMKSPIQTEKFLLFSHNEFLNNKKNIKKSWVIDNKSLLDAYTIEKYEKIQKYLKNKNIF